MKNYDAVKDSGEREEMETGSRRDTRDGKGRFDLISPFTLSRLARHMENGAKKYGDRNWELGQPYMRMYDSAMRHLMKWMLGMDDEDHLMAAIWNLHCLAHMEVMIAAGNLPPTLDDRPSYFLQGDFAAEEDFNGTVAMHLGLTS